ncbi:MULTISPECIES: hypothetical protein [Haloferax]|uniref:Uncharacterized protein n=1 Tax=Haloferax marinum TaxID=2666143 RepID=A0A6A8G4L1_9EURY|nr:MULTISPECIES: hypothetical protein [Haloferax]KAB1196094.1 hypothetical protein Hfx1150_00640 [Haloferax sp. CBA1150]MRW95076.1 hypothetical protein [Haloferax marinum]
MVQPKTRRTVAWTLLVLGVIGWVSTSGQLPGGPAMAAHSSLRAQSEFEAVVRLASLGLVLVGSVGVIADVVRQ